MQKRVESEGCVEVAFLDARKAFDCVWTDALFVKLYQKGVDAKLWRLLRNWYDDMQCKVRIKNATSDSFKVLIGVFQGGKWSSRLFQIFYSQLLDMLADSLLGCNLYDLRTVSPTYADDIAIVAPYKVTLQHLLNIVHSYSSKWRILFNPQKCVHMSFNAKGVVDADCSLYIGDSEIGTCNYTKHLGVGVGEEQMVVQEMIKKGKSAFSGIICLGKEMGGINPVIASKLYWSIVVPSMMYGAHVVSLSQESLETIEKEHRTFGKRIQALPSTTSNPAAYRLLGWKSIQAYYDLMVLTFFYKTLLLDASCIFRKAVTKRFIEVVMSDKALKGPTANFVYTCLKYNLLQPMQDYIDTGEGMSASQWKSLCRNVIQQKEDLFYYLDLCMAEKLVNMQMLQPGIHKWWKVAKAFPSSLRACQFLVKMLVGEEPLAWNTGRFVKPKCMENRMCKLCNSGSFENIRHFMFECSCLATTRFNFTNYLSEVCDFADTIVSLCDYKSVITARLPVGVDYKEKLCGIACKLWDMYKQRQDILREISN